MRTLPDKRCKERLKVVDGVRVTDGACLVHPILMDLVLDSCNSYLLSAWYLGVELPPNPLGLRASSLF